MSIIISDTPDGPVQTDMASLDDEQLRRWAMLGDPAAVKLLAERPDPPDWIGKASNRIARGRGGPDG